jgi:hypothetical protein
MRVDQAFARAGFEIVDAKSEGKEITISIRIRTENPLVPARWKALVEHILVTAEEAKTWSIDISRRFYSQRGRVHWMWRIIMRGSLKDCQIALTQATINTLRIGNEVKEVPLVGQQSLVPDPKNGKFKGAYPRDDEDRGSQAVAGAFIAG